MARLAHGADGLIRLPPPPEARRRAYTKGPPVKIIGGPFAGLSAIHSGMTAKEREVVLFVILGSARQVAIPSHLIAAQ